MKAPPVPRSLKARGRKIWRDLQAIVEFSAAETLVLTEMCRCIDTIDALAASIEQLGVTVAGSKGQTVVNPAIAELRQQQATLARLLPALHLPEEVDAESAFRARRGKAGAAGRWGSPSLAAVK